MTENILFFIGATFILKYGAPTKPIRDYLAKYEWGASLFNCSMCLGFWVGVFSIPFLYREILWFQIPFISAIVSWFGDLASKILIKKESGDL